MGSSEAVQEAAISLGAAAVNLAAQVITLVFPGGKKDLVVPSEDATFKETLEANDEDFSDKVMYVRGDGRAVRPDTPIRDVGGRVTATRPTENGAR